MTEMEKCPNCGGTKSMDLGNGKRRCLYCGTKFIVDQPAPMPQPQFQAGPMPQPPYQPAPMPQPPYQPAPPPQQPPMVVVNNNNRSCLDGCLKGTAGCILAIVAAVAGLIILGTVATCTH